MKIGIIGAGQIGGTLTRRLRALGHEVLVANSRGPGTLADLAAETGATAVPVAEAARSGELVVVTIPQGKVPSLPAGLFDGVPEGVVVVDTGNYYPRQRDGRIEPIEAGTVESRWAERELGRPVVKAFNNIYAQHLMERGEPAGTPGRIALPVAGDDPGGQGGGAAAHRRARLRRRRRRRAGRVLAAATRHPGLHRRPRRRGRPARVVGGAAGAHAGVERHRGQPRHLHRPGLTGFAQHPALSPAE